jgi:EAL and modified HD-GYP domain-containing signal transduction protein
VETLLFNRQPVYDRNLQVIGYEIVSEKPRGEDAGMQTNTLSPQVFSELEIEDVNTLASDGQLFLESVPQTFEEREWKILPEKSVLQIQLSASSDPKFSLDRLRSLHEKKHQIALTGINGREMPEYMRMADVLKMDVASSALSDLELTVDHMRKYKGKLLADKVETQKRYQACHEMGFDYFQGFFYCEPIEVAFRSIPANQAAMMNLLARIQDPKVDLKDLEKIISQDPALCFRLLRYLNSAGLGLTQKVDTISRAVNFLGLEPLKIWCSVLLLSRIESKPVELMKNSLTRGRMCQALAERKGDENSSAFFMTGLLSLLPAYMDRPMEDIVDELPLTDEVANGLVAGEGKIGSVLRDTVHYERGEWDKLEKSNFEKPILRSSYLDAVNFTEVSFRRLVE